MVEIITDYNAPLIADKLSETIKNIENINDTVLALQLTYRECHTLLYLKKIALIHFNEGFVEIKQKNNSSTYLDYNEILEYNIMHADNVIDLEVI